LLSEIRAHESAVIQALATQPSQGFRPPIVKVPPFGCDAVPERFEGAWEAFTAQCHARPNAWQAAISSAADLFGHWGLQLVALGFTPGDVFEIPHSGKQGGLAWFIRGSSAVALGPGFAKLEDGQAHRSVAGTGLWSATSGISVLWTRVSGTGLCSLFSNFRFPGGESGSTVGRDQFDALKLSRPVNQKHKELPAAKRDSEPP
jgi:hypothetical protein